MPSVWTPTKGELAARRKAEKIKTYFIITGGVLLLIGMVYTTRRFSLLTGGR